MKMKKILVLSFMLFFCGSAVFAAAARVADTITSSIAVKDVKTLHDAIIKGCEERGWVTVKTGENEITATLNSRSHQVVVKIPYDNSGYQIIYKGSKNMKYNARRNLIHPSYIRWTENLDKSIKANIDFKKDTE